MRACFVLAIGLVCLAPVTARADDRDLATLVIQVCRNKDTTLQNLDTSAAGTAKAAANPKAADADKPILAARAAAAKDLADKAHASDQALCQGEFVTRWTAFRAKQRAAAVQAPAAAPAPGADKPQAALPPLPAAAATLRDLPPQYLPPGSDVTVPPCGDLKNLVTAGTAEDTAVNQLCPSDLTAKLRSGSVDSAAIDLVQGLGDLIVAEAKQEVTTYVVETVGRQFCNFALDTGIPGDKYKKIALKTWFPATCAAMIQPSGDVVETITFGELQTTFKADLKALPGQLQELATAWFKQQSSTTQIAVVVLGAVAEIALDVVEHKTPVEILQEMATQVDDATKGVTCDFAQDPKAITAECVALLAVQIARTAADEYSPQAAPPTPSKVLGDAFNTFCQAHGSGAKAAGGACVVDPTNYLAWHARLLTFYRAVKQMIDVQSDLDKLRSQAPTDELKARTAKEFAAALQAVADGLGDIVTSLPGVKDGSPVKNAAAILSRAVAVYGAIIASDPAALRAALLAILDSPLVTAKLGTSSATVRAITVVIALATAKDRAEVKGILADVAAPVGTYKMKYGAPRQLVTVNGFVAAPVGGTYQLHQRDASGAAVASQRAWSRFRLAAPIGVDWTFASSKWLHLGVTATLIDPLALAVTTKDDELSANWKTLIDAGLYLRLGIARSPFLVMVGASYQPGLRDDNFGCGAQRCYDGGVQVGAMFSADVPIFILH